MQAERRAVSLHSGKSLFSISNALENFTIETIVGGEIALSNDVHIQECAEAFKYYLLLQHDLIARIIQVKEELDKNSDDNENILAIV